MASINYENGIFTRIPNDGQVIPVQRFGNNLAASASDQTLVAAISGSIIRVVYLWISPGAAAIVQFKSNANPISGNITYPAATAGLPGDFQPVGIFETVVSEALKVVVTSATVGFQIGYITYTP